MKQERGAVAVKRRSQAEEEARQRLFSLFHTLELWQINPHTWLTKYLSACAAAGSRVPEDFERFLPWNHRDGQAPRAPPQAPLRRAA